jgi:hypothetical protein
MSRVRIGATVITLALIGAASFSFQDDKPAETVRGFLPPYYKRLGLRDEQIAQIYKVRAGYKAKVDNLKRRIDKLKAEEKEALEKVLTVEQLKRLRQLRSGVEPVKDNKGKDKPKE